MKDFVSFFISGLGIVGFVGGLMAYLLLAPNLSTNRAKWFKEFPVVEVSLQCLVPLCLSYPSD